MSVATRWKLFWKNMRTMLAKHGWKGILAVFFMFFSYAVWHFGYPDVPDSQARVDAEREKIRTGESTWLASYNWDDQNNLYLYECTTMKFPFGHIFRLYPNGKLKAVFPAFIGFFIGRGFLCNTDGQIIGVYQSLWPKCVQSDYSESMPPPPPPGKWRY